MKLQQAVTAGAAAAVLTPAMGLLALPPVHAAQDRTVPRAEPSRKVGQIRPTPRLPDTGPAAAGGLLGAGLLIVGAAMVTVTRRRMTTGP
jgi:LPXTG-motif cell wall-anchored protein